MAENEEKGYTEHIVISKTNKKLIFTVCRQIYLENNPHRRGDHISCNDIMNSLIRTYVEVNRL